MKSKYLWLCGIGVALMIVLTGCVNLSPEAKFPPADYPQVYFHTFDECMDAAPTAIERLGWKITNVDKDKGTIAGAVPLGYPLPGFVPSGASEQPFEIHIETVSSKPETRVTLVELKTFATHGFGSQLNKSRAEQFSIEFSKALATLR